MSQIIRSSDHIRQIKSKGYIKLPLLDETACEQLRDIYESRPYTHRATGLGFYTALDQHNVEAGLRNSEQIIYTIRPYLKDYLKDFQAITATFIVKDPGASNISPIHQDWTFVDEQKYTSYMLWCPLQDVGLESGALGLLPETHRLLGDAARPSPSPPYESVFRADMSELFGYMDFISMPAGEALLFDHRILHGAMPNLGARSRIVVGISLTHKHAELHHHYLIPESNQAAILSVDKAFFFTYSNASLAELYQRKEFPDKYKAIYTYSFKGSALRPQELMSRVRNKQQLKEEVLELVPTLAQKASNEEQYEAPYTDPEHSVEVCATSETTPSKVKRFWNVYTPKNMLKELQYRLNKYTQSAQTEDSTTD